MTRPCDFEQVSGTLYSSTQDELPIGHTAKQIEFIVKHTVNALNCSPSSSFTELQNSGHFFKVSGFEDTNLSYDECEGSSYKQNLFSHANDKIVFSQVMNHDNQYKPTEHYKF